MNHKLLSIIFLAIVFSSGFCMAQAPSGIGGFVLGKNISEVESLVDMVTALPVRYAQYMTEVEIGELEGFKSGLIAYGNCDSPGKIFRIKLKYADESKKFYESLLKQFKQRFGEPDEWRGDPFHVMLAWKWSFTDGGGNRISLILQHNTRDTQEKMGNAVKLTMTSQMEKEHACYKSKHPGKARHKKENQKKGKTPNWERFIPR